MLKLERKQPQAKTLSLPMYDRSEKCTFKRQIMIVSWVDTNNYVTRGPHTITGKIFAKNSRQGIIPVLGPVLRTRIKDAY